MANVSLPTQFLGNIILLLHLMYHLDGTREAHKSMFIDQNSPQYGYKVHKTIRNFGAEMAKLRHVPEPFATQYHTFSAF